VGSAKELGKKTATSEKYQKALAGPKSLWKYQKALDMNGSERLADPNTVQKIKQGCLDDDVHLSGLTQRNIVLWGVPRGVIIEAMIRHIDEGCKIHVKTYPNAGQGCHGSLLLDPLDSDTLYFEVKLHAGCMQIHVSRVWLQVKEHSTGYPPLPP